jgi:lysophospholipase L1-like esterase
MNRFTILLMLLCSYLSARLSAQQIKPFKAGDRIMFVGNSITDAGFYHSYIWLYYMTRFPNSRMEIYNRGIGGDDIGQMNDRLDVEVFPEKPTVVALTFGMNDSGYFEYLRGDRDSVGNAKVKRAYNNYLKVEDKFNRHPEVRKIIFSTAPYDEATTATKNNLFPGKRNAILKIAEFQQVSAEKNHWDFLDLNQLMSAINLQQQAINPTFSLSPGDRIHPGVGGHLVMAYFFLKAQGFSDKEVANVSIDAAGSKLKKAINCKVSNLSAKSNAVAFTYLAQSLPFPIDTMPRMWNSKSTQAEALTIIPFIKEFNQEMITVKALQEGKYTLKIDDEKIGEWTATQFAEGVNLGEMMNTPQYQQAMVVRDLNQERMEIEKRFRQYNWVEFDVLKQRGLLRKHNQAAVDTVRSLINDGFVRGNAENWTKARNPAIRDAWNAQINLLVNKIYAVNKPLMHRITIERIN